MGVTMAVRPDVPSRADIRMNLSAVLHAEDGRVF
jgi:hypothetical protein